MHLVGQLFRKDNIMSDTPQSLCDTEISDLCPSLIAIFGNYVISDTVFLFLPVSDVLQCSLASKLFKKINRNFLRRRKTLEINLEFGKMSQLDKLNSMLMKCTDFPFVGSKLLLYHPRLLRIHDRKDALKMKLDRDFLCRQRRSQRYDVLKMYPYVFRKLPVKNLRIDFTRCFNMSMVRNHDVCFCEDVLKQLIIRRASSTEYVEILHWPVGLNLWQFLRIPQQSQGSTGLEQSNIFRSLRTCKLRDNGRGQLGGHEEFISQIAISSPVLENIYGPVPTYTFSSSGDPSKYPPYYPRSSILHLPESKYHVIREVVCDRRWMIDQLLKIKPKLEAFRFNLTAITEVTTDNGETKARAKIIVKKNLATIIENCRESLTTLVCQDAVHMLPHVINVPLVNCVNLELQLCAFYDDFADVLLSLKGVDFQKYLYNLRRVDLIFIQDFYVYGSPQKETQDRAFTCRSAKYTCLSVNTLSVTTHCQGHLTKVAEHWNAMADLFPNVKSLHFKDLCPELYRALNFPATWFDAKVVRNLGLPWNRNLEFFSCYITEKFDKPCLIVLTELLESMCDITAEQLATASRNEFNEWSYQPTRQLWLKRNCRIFLRLEHILCCKKKFGEAETNIYIARFDLIVSWIQAKLPELSLVLEFKPCEIGKLCNPIPFYNGRIQTNFEEDNSRFTSLPSGFRTWLLKF